MERSWLRMHAGMDGSADTCSETMKNVFSNKASVPRAPSPHAHIQIATVMVEALAILYGVFHPNLLTRRRKHTVSRKLPVQPLTAEMRPDYRKICCSSREVLNHRTIWSHFL